jgi:hypothetical protein
MKKHYPLELQTTSERAQNEQVRELLQIAPATDDQLQRSSRNKTGFKGVRETGNKTGNKFRAGCDTAPCHKHNLGTFETAEEAAQAYYGHFEEAHPDIGTKQSSNRPGSRKRRKLDEAEAKVLTDQADADAAQDAFLLGEDPSEMEVLDDQRVKAAAVLEDGFDDVFGVTDPLTEAARKARHDKAAREKREDEKKGDSTLCEHFRAEGPVQVE